MGRVFTREGFEKMLDVMLEDHGLTEKDKTGGVLLNEEIQVVDIARKTLYVPSKN